MLIKKREETGAAILDESPKPLSDTCDSQAASGRSGLASRLNFAPYLDSIKMSSQKQKLKSTCTVESRVEGK